VQKVVNLALQGGGSHGAFTRGVLDRLLEDDRLTFDGVTATSAGAINAVLLADGLAAGGRDAAKASLHRFWQRMSAIASRGIFQPSWIDKTNPDYGLEHSPGYVFMDVLSYFSSPYLFNPFNFNPLKGLLEEIVDFDRIRRLRPFKLFMSATNVQSGKVKIFTEKEVRVDHVLASTCLPLLMRPVEIGGEYFWDGAFVANPAIYPLVYECDSCDVVMVHITPAERREIPLASHAAMNRMQEIAYNATLVREMRAIAFLNRLMDQGKLTGAKRMLIHIIEADDVVRELSNSSKLNGDWDFLQHLHAVGRARAEAWLTANFDHLGVDSTVDLQGKYF
jgi:NTE family protein